MFCFSSAINRLLDNKSLGATVEEERNIVFQGSNNGECNLLNKILSKFLFILYFKDLFMLV